MRESQLGIGAKVSRRTVGCLVQHHPGLHLLYWAHWAEGETAGQGAGLAMSGGGDGRFMEESRECRGFARTGGCGGAGRGDGLICLITGGRPSLHLVLTGRDVLLLSRLYLHLVLLGFTGRLDAPELGAGEAGGEGDALVDRLEEVGGPGPDLVITGHHRGLQTLRLTGVSPSEASQPRDDSLAEPALSLPAAVDTAHLLLLLAGAGDVAVGRVGPGQQGVGGAGGEAVVGCVHGDRAGDVLAVQPGLADPPLHLDKPAAVRLRLLQPEAQVGLVVVGQGRQDQQDGQDEEEDNVEDGGEDRGGVGVAGGAAVLAATRAWGLTVRWCPPWLAVTVTQAVAGPVAVTVVGAGLGSDPQLPDRHALLVDTETVLPTPGALGSQARVHVVNTEVHQGRPAGDDLPPGVDEGVGEDGHGLHAELQPLVEVLTVQHPAPDVHVLAGDVALVDPVVAAVAVSAALPVLVVALVVRLLARGAPEQPTLV